MTNSSRNTRKNNFWLCMVWPW